MQILQGHEAAEYAMKNGVYENIQDGYDDWDAHKALSVAELSFKNEEEPVSFTGFESRVKRATLLDAFGDYGFKCRLDADSGVVVMWSDVRGHVWVLDRKENGVERVCREQAVRIAQRLIVA